MDTLGTLSNKHTLTHLFTVLFEQPELHALVKLDLLDLPQLEKLLLAGVNLVQKLHDHWDRALHVGIAGHVGGGTVPTGVPGIVAVSGLAGG